MTIRLNNPVCLSSKKMLLNQKKLDGEKLLSHYFLSHYIIERLLMDGNRQHISSKRKRYSYNPPNITIDLIRSCSLILALTIQRFYTLKTVQAKTRFTTKGSFSKSFVKSSEYKQKKIKKMFIISKKKHS